MISGKVMNGIDFLKEQYIQQLSLAMAKMFMKNNELWASFNLKLEEVRQLFVDILHEHLGSEARTQSYMGDRKRVNFVYLIDGKIASSLHHYELEDYRNYHQTKKTSKVGLFDNLEKYGKELFKDVDMSLFQKGKHLYANVGFTNDEVSPPKFTYEMMIQYCKYLKQAGFKSMICRTSNPRTDLLYKSLGGKVIKQLTFNENGVSGPLGLVTLEFNNPVFDQILEKRAKLEQKQDQKQNN